LKLEFFITTFPKFANTFVLVFLIKIRKGKGMIYKPYEKNKIIFAPNNI
jgi:hypothetical protein